MTGDTSFRDLIARVRAGDQEAATELVRRYEPAIRRTVRARLRDSQLRRLLDSTDICQSVLMSFFTRAAQGRYELGSPEELLQLLTSMAHHKLTNQVHKQQAQRRDIRLNQGVPVEEFQVVAPGSSPSEHVALQELLQKARCLFSPDEQRLADLREQGRDWSEIAQQLGGSPEALRKQLQRARERVFQQLGLEDEVRDA